MSSGHAEHRAGAELEELAGQVAGVDPVAAGPGEHDAAVDVERAERDDQRGHAAVRHQHAVDEAEDRAEQEARREHRDDRDVGLLDEQPAGQVGGQRHHRADGQVDVAGDDHDGLADGEQDQDRRVEQEVAPPVAAEQEAVVLRGREHDDGHQHEEDRQLARAQHGRQRAARRREPARLDEQRLARGHLGVGALVARVGALDVGVAHVFGVPAGLFGGAKRRRRTPWGVHRTSSRWWVAACMTASGVASARSSSAVIRPSHRTSDAVGHAEDLGELGGDHQDREALPGELGEQPVHLGLGADVDAAGGLVDDQQPGIGGQPLGDDDLLLVAAAHRGRGHVERAGLHLQASGPGAGGPVLHGRGEQPGLRDAAADDAGDVAGRPRSR